MSTDYTFEAHGREFSAIVLSDDNSDTPLDREDGHGPVRFERTARGKAPGEWPAHTGNGGDYMLYDSRAALEQARREGWGLGPRELDGLRRDLGREPTRREVVAEAVRRDFERLAGFFRGEWWYVGVIVRDEQTGQTSGLWGIESDSTEYLRETAQELADELAHENGWTEPQRAAAWRAALHEAREVRAWAARDVVTA
jgi:hypothetical protein